MNRRHFLAGVAATATLPVFNAEGAAPATRPTTRPFGLASPPVLLNPSADSVTVVVMPASLATGWVEYGETEALGQRCFGESRGQRPLSDRLLVFRLRGLAPGRRYFYRVHLKSINFRTAYSIRSGEEIRDEMRSFRTLNPDSDSASFTVWNDTHENLATLAALSESLNAAPTDFLIWNGDVTNDIHDESKIAAQFLAPAGQPFAATVPFFLGRGNHDVRGRDARFLSNYITGPAGDYCYSFRHGPLAVVVLDSGEDKPDDLPVYAGLSGFDAYRQAQRGFLEKTLADPAFASAPFKVLFVHIPLFWETDVPSDWPGVWGKDLKGQVIKGWICQDGLARWHDLLVKAGVDLVISGHTHKHAYFPPNERHPYGQLVGGGPRPNQATRIVGTVSRNEMTVVVNDLEGRLLLRQSFKPR